MAKPRKSETKTIVAAIFIGSVLFGVGSWLYFQGLETMSWRETPGVIKSCTIDDPDAGSLGSRNRGVFIEVHYTYVVDGVTYDGDRLEIQELSRTLEAAQEVVDRYPVGAEVAVAYDPVDPGESVLERGGLQGLGTQAAGLGIYCVALLWLREATYRKSMKLAIVAYFAVLLVVFAALAVWQLAPQWP